MIKQNINYIILFIGINIYAASINLLISLNLGMGSFDSLTLQLQQLFNIQEFGNASFLLHFGFFIILLIFSKRLEVSVRMVYLSLLSTFILTRFVNLYDFLGVNPSHLILSSIVVILILNFGLYLIAKSNLIIAPFDKLVVESSKYKKVEIGKSRLFFDCLVLLVVIIINLYLQEPIKVSLYTLIITFATGLNIYGYEVLIKWLQQKVNYRG